MSSHKRVGVGLAALAFVAATAAVLTFTPAGETVASFADQEFGIGTFSATSMNMQGNATDDVSDDSDGWTDHFTDGEAAVFEPTVGALVPGSTRSYSRFGLRLEVGSTDDATATVAAGTQVSPSTQANLFSMRLVQTTSTTCDLNTFNAGAAFLVGSTSSFGTMLTAPSAEFTLASTGEPVYLCYEFSLPNTTPPAGLTNGATAIVRWTVNAESTA